MNWEERKELSETMIELLSLLPPLPSPSVVVTRLPVLNREGVEEEEEEEAYHPLQKREEDHHLY